MLSLPRETDSPPTRAEHPRRHAMRPVDDAIVLPSGSAAQEGDELDKGPGRKTRIRPSRGAQPATGDADGKEAMEEQPPPAVQRGHFR